MSSIDRLLRNVALLYVTRSSSSVDLELFVKLFIIRKFHFSYILGIHLPLLLLFRHLPLQQSFVVYGDRVPIHVVDPILLYSCHSSQKLNGWFLCCCCSLVVKFNDSPVGNSIGVTIIMIHQRRNHIPPPRAISLRNDKTRSSIILLGLECSYTRTTSSRFDDSPST